MKQSEKQDIEDVTVEKVQFEKEKWLPLIEELKRRKAARDHINNSIYYH